jgi:anti-sigma factor RsiW
MVDHAEMSLMMSLALDGMLTAGDQQAFEAHLRQCARCQSEWERWQGVDALLAAEPQLSPAPDFAAGVLDRVGKRGERRRRLLGGALLVGGSLSVWGMMALALVMASLLWFLSDPSMVVHGAHLLSQLLAAGGVLATAVRLGLEGLCHPFIWPWMATYVCSVLALTWLWVRLVQRRSLRSSVPQIVL